MLSCIGGALPCAAACSLGYGAVDAGYKCYRCPVNTFYDGRPAAPPLPTCTRCPDNTFTDFEGATYCRPFPVPGKYIIKRYISLHAVHGIHCPCIRRAAHTVLCPLASSSTRCMPCPLLSMCVLSVPAAKCGVQPGTPTGITWPYCVNQDSCTAPCGAGFVGGPVTVRCNNGVWSAPVGVCTVPPPGELTQLHFTHTSSGWLAPCVAAVFCQADATTA